MKEAVDRISIRSMIFKKVRYICFKILITNTCRQARLATHRCNGPCSTAARSVSHAHIGRATHRLRDWSASIGSHMQQDMVIPQAPPRHAARPTTNKNQTIGDNFHSEIILAYFTPRRATIRINFGGMTMWSKMALINSSGVTTKQLITAYTLQCLHTAGPVVGMVQCWIVLGNVADLGGWRMSFAGLVVQPDPGLKHLPRWFKMHLLMDVVDFVRFPSMFHTWIFRDLFSIPGGMGGGWEGRGGASVRIPYV